MVQVCRCGVDGQGHSQCVVFLVQQKAASGALNRSKLYSYMVCGWVGLLTFSVVPVSPQTLACGILFKNVPGCLFKAVWESGQIPKARTLGVILAMRCLHAGVGNSLTRSDRLSWRGRNRFVTPRCATVNMVQHPLSSLVLKAESMLRFRLDSLKTSLRSGRG